MKFRTEIHIAPFAEEACIGYENRTLALGSCFAQEMTARLRDHRFHCTTNPTGVLFNPASIARALQTFICPAPVTADELHHADDLWYHFDFHGSFSHADRDRALAQMNAARQAGTKAFEHADRVILTFGTAWVYEHDRTIVANCHRCPASEFVRHRLSVDQIVQTYAPLLSGPLAKKQIILTVSPVRHLGDGLDGNAVSKATLRLAAEELAAAYPNVHYFPAYEIVLDDLRDYRFYADDLTHPAAQAVEYIWEHFSQVALTNEAKKLLPIVEQVIAAAAHRPRHPESEEFRTFCRAQLMRIETLPQINLTEERHYFEKYIQ